MLLEVRVYRIKEGLREKFVNLFDSQLVAAQRAKGMRVLGQFTSLDDENVFVWLRGFDDEQQRQEQSKALYEDETWIREYAPLAADYIEDVHVLTVQATRGSDIQ